MVCVDDPVEPAEPKRKRVEKRKIGPRWNWFLLPRSLYGAKLWSG